MRFMKLAIFLVFFWNAGIVPLFQEASNDETPTIERSYQEQLLSERQANDFWSAKHHIALDKVSRGERYTPDDYFSAMIEYYQKFNGISIGINHSFNSCQGLMVSHLENDDKSKNELTKARDKFYYATGQADKTSDRQEQIDYPKIFTAIWHWLLGMYWHNFIFALFLFAIWDAERRGQIAVKNPVSILLNTIFHPVTIAIIAYQYFSSKVMEAELRRTKDALLTALSEDEWSALKLAIHQGLSHREFRTLLKSRNLVIKHSLVWGLVATLTVSIWPVPVLTEQDDCSVDREWTRLCVQSDSGLSISKDYDSQDHSQDIGIDCLVQSVVRLVIFIEVSFVKTGRFLFREFILWRRIAHIPLLNS